MRSLRIGSYNVRGLRARAREVDDLMEKERLDILAVQVYRWEAVIRKPHENGR